MSPPAMSNLWPSHVVRVRAVLRAITDALGVAAMPWPSGRTWLTTRASRHDMIGRPSRAARLILLSILEQSHRQGSSGRVQPPIRPQLRDGRQRLAE
jgi:hypothetical protein